MTREILVNVTPHEVRAALLENGLAQEFFIERSGRRGLVGNLYKGRVARVLPGMQAAFIDAGLARTAFLHVADIAGASAPAMPVTQAAIAAEAGAASPPQQTDIRRLLTEGDEILVQVIKDPLGSKGARLSTYISLASRYLVYMPRGSGVGVSARIEDESERERLRLVLRALTETQASGYIVRTAADGATPEALRADLLYLARLWEHLQQRYLQTPAGALLHEELALPLRVLRDELSDEVRRVLVDSPTEHARMQAFAATFMPEAIGRIEYYQEARPLFDLHGVEQELARALERRVELKSGGYLMIDQTESMTTVDVNTGAYVGHRNLEETIFRTNLEAAVAIARQLRLRNLGGIIIIDFIDMEEAGHREHLLAALQAALATDRAQNQIASVSALGLVEMTRKRTRESLEHILCEPCRHCAGRGSRKSVETICHEIYREVLRQARQFTVEQFLILAHPEVIEQLLDEEAPVMAELEAQVQRPIRLQAETRHDVDQYDVILA
ncbi:MAG: ribonuclease G [Steroidobacterales bacterium]